MFIQAFEHTLHSTREIRHESRCFFRCILFVLSNIQCCANQGPAKLRLSFVQDVCTVMQIFVHRFRTRCHKDTLRLLKLFLPNETKLIRQSQCVRRIVNPEFFSAFHTTFLRKISTVVKNPGSTRLQALTLNVSRINCPRSCALTPEMAGMKPSLQ